MILIRAVLPILTVIALIGCSKVNQQNFNELEVGFSYKTVKGLLGEPDQCTQQLGTQSCVWSDEERFIRASFVANKLVLYSGEGL